MLPSKPTLRISKPQRKPPHKNAPLKQKKAATNHSGSICNSDANKAAQSIPLVAFHNKAIDSTTRMVGQLRFRRYFQRGDVLAGADFALIAVRIKQVRT
jgi:hypothetical protein